MEWLVIPFSVLISWLYISLEQVGESTENPFEGSLGYRLQQDGYKHYTI